MSKIVMDVHHNFLKSKAGVSNVLVQFSLK